MFQNGGSQNQQEGYAMYASAGGDTWRDKQFPDGSVHRCHGVQSSGYGSTMITYDYCD
jgi:hypothetical protein